MSHWGATVITNLFSAIPFVGQDLVPFNIVLPLYLLYIYICVILKIMFNLMLNSILLIIYIIWN